MTAVFRYISYDGTTFSVNIGNTAIRLGKVPGFTELALLGAVGTSSVVVEDTTGTAGHASDGFLPLQIFAVDELAATPQRLYAGWTGLIEDVTGPEGPTDSLRTGVQNRITINLEDANTLAGRRALKPKASDSSVNRPAETASARISWLLGTAYFSGVADNGLVHPAGSPTLTANDYSQAHPADVMNDCCTATGDNWFVYWDRTAAAWSLAVFNFTTYNGYVATMGLSNVVGLYDSSTAGAGISNVWAIEPGARLTKDPATLGTEVQYTYAKGTVDVVGSSATYPVVTQVASSTTVKSSALATTKATRYLADNAAPQHRITCDAKILAAHVDDALPGQLIIASFRQWPQYASASYFRIAGRTVAQAEESDQFWAVNYQLIPAAPVSPSPAFAVLDHQFISGASAQSLGTFLMTASNTGDTPPAGYAPQPKTGLVDYDATGVISPGVATGIKFLGAGSDVAITVSTRSDFVFDFGSPGGSTFQMLAKIGSSVVASSSILTDTGTGLHSYGAALSISASGITVATNDILQIYYVIGVTAPHSGSVPSAGTFAPPYQLVVTGTLS